jgi:hypothetical protein
MTRRIIRYVAWLGLVAAACNESSHAPAPTSPSASVPKSASVLAGTLTSVSISGPTVIEPGASSQYVATASFSDLTKTDVTASAVWRSGTPVFTIASPGLVAAVTVGEGSISISYQGRSAFLNIVSLPAGTGILAGHITQAGLPVVGATIQVVGGPYAGRSTTSDGSGFYRFYGIVGDLQIRVSKDGYTDLTKVITVSPFATPRRDQTLDFDMSLAGTPVALAGTYLVTLRASAACGGKLPSDAMVRNYTAMITQVGERLTVALGGATFGSDSHGVPVNSFIGRLQPGSIQFSIGSLGAFYYYYYYYAPTWGVIERLAHAQTGLWGVSSNDFLALAGTVTAFITQSSTLSATLNGIVSMQAPSGNSYRTLTSCKAPDHQLILVRQ